jgi:hypothetical protein
MLLINLVKKSTLLVDFLFLNRFFLYLYHDEVLLRGDKMGH